MRLLLSGEGPSDLGICDVHQEWDRYAGCHCADASEPPKPGPLAILVDRIASTVMKYSLLENNDVCIVNEHALVSCSKTLRPRRAPILPGLENKKDTGYFRRNAQALGSIAQRVSEARDMPVVAVLFRDCDGTQASTRSLWQEKYESMKNGFEDVGFAHGVPMLPKPKSEAWLLCALKANPYQNCAVLENASGNDNSPNALKTQLGNAIGHTFDLEEIIEWVQDGKIDPERIDMPSWNQFKKDFTKALQDARR